jgi:predicted phosphodiesterase
MRTAIISDIHGNYAGLLVVLADIEQYQCDRILCLGDLVDGGPQSVEVVQLFQARSLTTVQGNHDEYPNAGLPLDIENYLQQLPEAIVEGQVIYTHTSPRDRKAKIIDDVEAWNVFEEVGYTRIFVGDIHIPLIFGQQCPQKVSATAYPIPYDEEFRFAGEDRYIVCVGSVGYSRDGYNWLRYAIFDSERDSIMFRAPEGPILVF